MVMIVLCCTILFVYVPTIKSYQFYNHGLHISHFKSTKWFKTSLAKKFPVLRALPINDNQNSSNDKNTTIVDQIGNQDFNSFSNRPPIIPYDFVRDEFIAKPPSANTKSIAKSKEQIKQVNTPIMDKSKKTINPLLSDVNARPTGYANTDDNDDEIDTSQNASSEDFQTQLVSDSPILQFINNVFIDNDYDTRKKKQAKSVFRNIAVISISIGIIFTGIWYLFPGKFINVRGNMDLTSRYKNEFNDPNGLLFDNINSYDNQLSKYLDNGENLPTKPNEFTRYGVEDNAINKDIKGYSEDL